MGLERVNVCPWLLGVHKWHYDLVEGLCLKVLWKGSEVQMNATFWLLYFNCPCTHIGQFYYPKRQNNAKVFFLKVGDI